MKREKRGGVSVLGDDGYPYGVPLDHYYDEGSGKLYFHCAKAGYKLDAIRASDKVSYCITGEGRHEDGVEWSLTFRSVIVFGRMRVLEDEEAAPGAAAQPFRMDGQQKNRRRKAGGFLLNKCDQLKSSSGRTLFFPSSMVKTEARSFLEYGSFASLRSWIFSTTLPCCMMTMLSQKLFARARSWQMNM